VLLVDDNESQPPRGSEDGAAGADHHLYPAVGDAPPVPAALDLAQMAVQHGHRTAPPLKALNRLRRQADLGHQNDGFLALPYDFLDGAQIDFCLAAASDAVQ